MKSKVKMFCRVVIVFCAIVIFMYMISVVHLNEGFRGEVILLAVAASVVNYMVSK